MSNAQLKTIEDHIQLHRRNTLCHAIRAAVDLGIMDSLAEGQKTSEQMATALSLDKLATARLMNVLANTELIEKYDEDYALSTVARLIPRPFLDFGNSYWQYLASHVRTGSSLEADDSIPHTEADFLATQAHKEWMLTPVALDVAQVLSMGKDRQAFKILEVGCGSAVFGVTLAHRDPLSSLTLLDDATSLKRAAQTIESVELKSEVTQLTGDWDDFSACEYLEPFSFDLVLIANRLHWRRPEQCEHMFKQLTTLLKPDGELAIVDIFPGQAKGDQARAERDLELGLRISAGQLHDPLWLQQALERSGYRGVQFAHLPSDPGYWGILLATRI